MTDRCIFIHVMHHHSPIIYLFLSESNVYLYRLIALGTLWRKRSENG